MYTMGFIGTGNMGSALAKAAAKKLGGNVLALSNRSAAKAAALAQEIGAFAASNAIVASDSKYIFLGVKPQMMADMLADIAPILKKRTSPFVLVTMAAGLSMERICALAGGEWPVIRIMPNTPCAIGQGVLLCCRNEKVTDEDYAFFTDAMSESGLVKEIAEKLIDAGSALSGCGPAFVYTFIEALADAAVSLGLTRADALDLAGATVQGAAAMTLQSDEHPARLRDRVCSPGGSTIAGVLSMEKDGFRAAAAGAVLAAYEKTLELGK